MKIKNWKTTVAGVAVALIAVASTLHIITPDQAAAITTVLVSFGLIAAKDNNVTGGTKQQ